MDMNSFYSQRRLLLAPMAGVSDEAFRMLCREQGAALTYTEMVSAKALSFSNEKTKGLLRLAENEDLIAVQIFGHEPEVMAKEALWIEKYLGERLAYIDVNMGCPAKKIVKKGDGCALMKTPELAAEIVNAVSSSIEAPLSVKFRRGFEKGQETAVDFARRMEEAGAAAVSIHGRYAEQLYQGHADWSVIARVKEAVEIPVVGNGDLTSGTDVVAMLNQTACSAFMIGRAARGNPWVFSEAKAALAGETLPKKPNAVQRIAMARRHACLLDGRPGNETVRMRKHAMWYFSGLPGAAAARGKINGCVSLDDFNTVFDELLEFQEG